LSVINKKGASITWPMIATLISIIQETSSFHSMLNQNITTGMAARNYQILFWRLTHQRIVGRNIPKNHIQEMLLKKGGCSINHTGGTMNKLFGILIVILVCTSAVADENDFRCLKSIGVKTPLRLQFVFQTDKPDAGYVIYQNGSRPIAVKMIKEREVRRVKGGGPSEIEAQWEEITSADTDGKYVVVSQGA
jgi:hypothetical protein